MARQNRRRSAPRATEGLPGERKMLRPLRSERRRLRAVIATTSFGVLRRPLESAQYTSIAFGRRCEEAGVRPSMGSVGDCYDNALCESFFATLECELLDRRRFKTRRKRKWRSLTSSRPGTTRIAATRPWGSRAPSTSRGGTPLRPENLSGQPSTKAGQLQTRFTSSSRRGHREPAGAESSERQSEAPGVPLQAAPVFGCGPAKRKLDASRLLAAKREAFSITSVSSRIQHAAN